MQTGGIISSDKLRVLAGGTGDVDLQKANLVNTVAAKVAGGTFALNNDWARWWAPSPAMVIWQRHDGVGHDTSASNIATSWSRRLAGLTLT